jgi:ribonuclease HI
MINNADCYVDGSFNNFSKIYGYASILIHNNNEYIIKGHGDDSQYVMLQNVAGELIAVIKTLEFVNNNNLKLDKINLFYDYEGIEKIAKGEWKRDRRLFKEYYNIIKYTKIDILFYKIKSHSGNEFNDKVDKLAKMECGIISTD